MWNDTTTSFVPAARVRSTAPGGSSPSSPAAKPAGAPSIATTLPSLMPSFFGSGVPE